MAKRLLSGSTVRVVYNAKNKTRMENILLDQVLKQVQNREISIEKARELICVLFNVRKSATVKSSGDFRDDDNRESQSEYYGRK
jgi:hypothetical protein